MNYENDLRIDESALDVEWLEQPMLFMTYARISAEARRTLDEEKQNLDIVKAEIDRDIRENPSVHGLEKVTDKAVEAIILSNSKYVKAYKKYLDAKYEADMASSAVQAFNQRKEALENLVKLHGQSYFAGPRVPRDLHKEVEEKQAKVDESIIIRRTKK